MAEEVGDVDVQPPLDLPLHLPFPTEEVGDVDVQPLETTRAERLALRDARRPTGTPAS